MKQYIEMLKKEFAGYNGKKLAKDIMAGLTVAAVALPLALAFGVSSGADGAAGLITAIMAGLMIGTLSGASYQISGPTGAMSAILISLSQTYGLQGVFIASLISGIMLLIASFFKFGKLVSFIPTSVIAGFTSGIAILIFTQQIDNFFGVQCAGSTTIEKMLSYFDGRFTPNLTATLIGLCVVLIMILYPKKWSNVVPSSLVSIVIMLLANMIFKFDVAVVGEIPSTLLPEVRLNLFEVNWAQIGNFMMPAFSIAALGMIESLLCGASAGKMKNEKMNADQELFAQGIGNMIIPFFGGVPATAAIARTSVAIKAGGETRLTSIFHAIVLLLAMFILGPFMAKIPLSALAGVLIVTAWRMNEWHHIRSMFKNKVKTPILQFLITMMATVVFDLTVAIVMGVLLAMFMFVLNNSNLSIAVSHVDTDRIDVNYHHNATKVVYLTGPLFFGTQNQLLSTVEQLLEENCEAIILSMRGVPSIDDSGIAELEEINALCKIRNVPLLFSGVQDNVYKFMYRAHFNEQVSEDKFFWDTMGAIHFVDKDFKYKLEQE